MAFLSKAFSWFPGSHSVDFTRSDEPLIIPMKNGVKRAFVELCRDITPPCNLNPFLPGGHLQTAWTALNSTGPHIHYKRRTFIAEDPAFPGNFAVDFVVAPPPKKNVVAEDGGLDDRGPRIDPLNIGHTMLPPRTTYFSNEEFEGLASDDRKPLLITLHGLSGGSYEAYLRHVLAPLVAETTEGRKSGLNNGDWDALVVNSRGCAGSKITSPILYNARATWDMRQVVKWARKTWPNKPIFAVGYSLGANILTNYCGEEGDRCILSAAMVVSNPWDLLICAKSLQRSYIGSEVYSKHMATNMKGLVELHKEQMLRNIDLDLETVRKGKYLFEFDRCVQCAAWGYPTEAAYYRDASSCDALLAIRIPFFALNAKDDPIAVDEAIPYEEFRHNPYTVLCTTSGGGHLSWFEWGGSRWHARPVVNYFNTMASVVETSQIDAPEVKYAPGKLGKHPFDYDPMRRTTYVHRE